MSRAFGLTIGKNKSPGGIKSTVNNIVVPVIYLDLGGLSGIVSPVEADGKNIPGMRI